MGWMSWAKSTGAEALEATACTNFPAGGASNFDFAMKSGGTLETSDGSIAVARARMAQLVAAPEIQPSAPCGNPLSIGG